GVPRDPRVTMKVAVADLSRCLIFDSPRFRYPSGRVENFKRDKITGRVVVQNHAGLVLVTLSNGDAVLQYHAERIRPTVVGDLHDLGGPSVNIYDHAYKIHCWRLPSRTRKRCSAEATTTMPSVTSRRCIS